MAQTVSVSDGCLALQAVLLKLKREHLSQQLCLFRCRATTICRYDNTCLYNHWLAMGVGGYTTPLTICYLGTGCFHATASITPYSLLRKWRFSTQRVQMSQYVFLPSPMDKSAYEIIIQFVWANISYSELVDWFLRTLVWMLFYWRPPWSLTFYWISYTP
jgi:hypothetical protein